MFAKVKRASGNSQLHAHDDYANDTCSAAQHPSIKWSLCSWRLKALTKKGSAETSIFSLTWCLPAPSETWIS
jgi:hypothetical protein